MTAALHHWLTYFHPLFYLERHFGLIYFTVRRLQIALKLVSWCSLVLETAHNQHENIFILLINLSYV